MSPNGAAYPPIANIVAPIRGPPKSPSPPAISINPIFYSLSLFFEYATRRDMVDVELNPAPIPFNTCEANDRIRKKVLS